MSEDIDILSDVLIILLGTLMRINRGEITKDETEEFLLKAMVRLEPLMDKRLTDLIGTIN